MSNDQRNHGVTSGNGGNVGWAVNLGQKDIGCIGTELGHSAIERDDVAHGGIGESFSAKDINRLGCAGIAVGCSRPNPEALRSLGGHQSAHSSHILAVEWREEFIAVDLGNGRVDLLAGSSCAQCSDRAECAEREHDADSATKVLLYTRRPNLTYTIFIYTTGVSG